jgi:hypothetical protein
MATPPPRRPNATKPRTPAERGEELAAAQVKLKEEAAERRAAREAAAAEAPKKPRLRGRL